MSEREKHILTDCQDLRTQVKTGDLVTFDSVGEARNVIELLRSVSATVVATGRALAVYPTYILVELQNGVRECANRGNIYEIISIAD